MEKVDGITAEYDPFHNGHAYQLAAVREQISPAAVVCVMSGNFTQRGEPAVLDKWARARIAVEQGADLVFELPFPYACSRAEMFARGAVDILASAGVTHISFGCEAEHPAELQRLAVLQADREHQMETMIREHMKDGCSRAKGLELASRELFGEELSDLLLSPNNILALEYLKRMRWWEKNRGVVIDPVPILRRGSGYRDADAAAGFAGASAIRQMIEDEKTGRRSIDRYLPYDSGAIPWMDLPRARQELYRHVRGIILRSTAQQLSQIYCVGEGMEHRLIREARKNETFESFLTSMVSRRYTASAIRRILVYILMNIEEMPACEPYGRVLAADSAGRRLLRRISDEETMPVIANGNRLTDLQESIRRSLRAEHLATDMFNLICGCSLEKAGDSRRQPYME